MRILIVEDEVRVAKFLKKALEKRKYSCDIVNDGKDALVSLEANVFDAIVLDINIPNIDGFELCKTIREKGYNAPILMLSARDNVKDKVKGLDLGADDYLVKPFSVDELLARIRSMFRKFSGEKVGQIKVKDLVLDINKREVYYNGKSVRISSKEFKILEYMAFRKDEVVTRNEILEHVWGEQEENVFTNTVDVHINYLRRKLGKNVVETVRGFGYMISTK